MLDIVSQLYLHAMLGFVVGLLSPCLPVSVGKVAHGFVEVSEVGREDKGEDETEDGEHNVTMRKLSVTIAFLIGVMSSGGGLGVMIGSKSEAWVNSRVGKVRVLDCSGRSEGDDSRDGRVAQANGVDQPLHPCWCSGVCELVRSHKDEQLPDGGDDVEWDEPRDIDG